jgi:hypothetical protein
MLSCEQCHVRSTRHHAQLRWPSLKHGRTVFQGSWQKPVDRSVQRKAVLLQILHNASQLATTCAWFKTVVQECLQCFLCCCGCASCLLRGTYDRSVQSAAAKRKLLCREAFHYKEHPANKAVAALLQVRRVQHTFSCCWSCCYGRDIVAACMPVVNPIV